MPREIKILCVHGVGNHRRSPEWMAIWKDAISSSIRVWSPDDRLDFAFVHYDDLFEAAPLGAGDVAAALGKLLASGIWHGVGDLFRRRRGLRDFPERVRWTAGMVVQWAENRRLRGRLRRRVRREIEASDPDVVCAHSLGSLVTYDTFVSPGGAELIDGRTYLTFGSQIGNPFVRGMFGGRIRAVPAKAWFQLYNREDDLFTARVRLHDDRFHEIDTFFDIAGLADHDAARYLSHSRAVHSVWQSVATARRPRAVRASEIALRRKARRPKRRALLVGINDYPDPAMRLEGCVNDTFLISSLLQECGFEAEDIRLVLDDRATAGGIRERIEWLLDGASADDQRVLFYSGHGAQISGYGIGETVDRVDECLVPYDFDWSWEKAYTDDEFHELYSQLPYETHFVIILDCCHSGGMTRGSGQRIRGIDPPDDIRHRRLRWDAGAESWVERVPEPPNRDLCGGSYGEDFVGETGCVHRFGRSVDLRTLPVGRYRTVKRELGHRGPFLPLIYQACQESDLAYEYRHGVTAYGAFSYTLARVLRQRRRRGRNLTFEALLGAVRRELPRLGYEQTPSLVGPRRLRRRRVPWLEA